ncbi:hypothetical protein, partial [Streptomyces sp. NPDC127574]|uniref:hypothetical protein n=1 Tax=Streptomyces sp. NPDC127574 TaxID=3345401 RepID=UPI0036264024
MPEGQPKKSRKRTRDIREQARAAGTSYTEAMRANDRTRAGGEQPQRTSAVRTLLLPLERQALEGLFDLGLLLLRLQNVLVLDRDGSMMDVMGLEGVRIPGAPVEEVQKAYWRVCDALPPGTAEFADGAFDEYPPTPNVLLLLDPDGANVTHLTTIEVAEA